MKKITYLSAFIIFIGSFLLFAGEAFAETFPYTKTYTITAYYSPLPCQNRYVTGSYESDIRLNGSGVNSADGTPVYPGMVAAPKNYQFGTKMFIPGIGTVAVHDRGGAIVNAGGRDGIYHDRLDIWMGWGDKGLNRALEWGKRNVDVTVYGLDESILENVSLPGFSYDEAVPNDCSSISTNTIQPIAFETPEPKTNTPEPDPVPKLQEEEEAEATQKPAYNVMQSPILNEDLQFNDTGDKVISLQKELKNLNYYKGDLNGMYDEVTKHAVFKFQQAQYLVGDANSEGAGIFGPKTRDRLNEIISQRNYSKVLIAEATFEYNQTLTNTTLLADSTTEEPIIDEPDPGILIATELDYGISGHEVRLLQTFLHEQGYFNSSLITDYFGPATREAVLRFQIANKIVNSEYDLGAGRVGPSTLRLINSLS